MESEKEKFPHFPCVLTSKSENPPTMKGSGSVIYDPSGSVDPMRCVPQMHRQ